MNDISSKRGEVFLICTLLEQCGDMMRSFQSDISNIAVEGLKSH